jgi:hypothetical protein
MNRTSPRLAFSLLGSFLTVGSLVGGCGGDGGGKMYPEASVDFDAHNDAVSDGGADATKPDTGPAAPTVNPDSKLILSGNIGLVGSGADTCTNQLPPTGDRWCAFSHVSTDLFHNELWVVNVSKVAAGGAVQCVASAADPNCIRLSTALYSDQQIGFRVHGFDGDTLTFLEDEAANGGGSSYIGHIKAWRPGWKAPHSLTGSEGLFCNGHALTNTAVCLENPVPDSTNKYNHTIELHAGRLEDTDAPLPLVGTIILQAPNDPAFSDGTPVRKWGVRLSPDGNSIGWSTRATDTGTEDLHWQLLDDDSTRTTVVTDVDQWTISPDSQKWYWLKSFNYDVNGAPSGALQSATYPGGDTVKPIAANVGDYLPAANSVYFRSKVMNDVGALQLVVDREAPQTVTMVDDGVALVFGASKDAKNAIYAKNAQVITDTSFFVFDAFVAGAANTMPCNFAKTSAPGISFIQPTFLANGSLISWARLSATQEIEGVSTSVPGCATRKFASDLFDSTPIGDEGLVYVDSFSDTSVSEATLRFGVVDKNGQLPAPGVVVQARSGLEYAPLAPALDAVLYTITSNTSVDGLYLNTKLQFTTVPTVDAGTGTDATTTTDAGSDAAASDAGATEGGASDAVPSDAGSADTSSADGGATDASSGG